MKRRSIHVTPNHPHLSPLRPAPHHPPQRPMRKTSAVDGVCSVCRTSLKNRQGRQLTEDQAIEQTELLLSILKWHRKGVSYAQISEMLGVPRSTAFVMAMRARNMEPTALEVANPDAGLEDRLLGATRN